MTTNLQLFGPIHWAIIIAIPLLAGGLAMWARRVPAAARPLCIAIGIFLAAGEIAWWIFKYSHEGWRFPEGLPLQLCDLAVWLAVFACLTLRPLIYEFAYYAGIGGSMMAVLQPDLWAPLCSYSTIYFFVSHGGVVVAVLYLTWARLARPRPGSAWRALALLCVWVAIVGSFDAVFRTNYVYLRSKPASASILDFFGPWPWYIFGAFGVALILFLLMSLPFRHTASGHEV